MTEETNNQATTQPETTPAAPSDAPAASQPEPKRNRGRLDLITEDHLSGKVPFYSKAGNVIPVCTLKGMVHLRPAQAGDHFAKKIRNRRNLNDKLRHVMGIPLRKLLTGLSLEKMKSNKFINEHMDDSVAEVIALACAIKAILPSSDQLEFVRFIADRTCGPVQIRLAGPDGGPVEIQTGPSLRQSYAALKEFTDRLPQLPQLSDDEQRPEEEDMIEAESEPSKERPDDKPGQ